MTDKPTREELEAALVEARRESDRLTLTAANLAAQRERHEATPAAKNDPHARLLRERFAKMEAETETEAKALRDLIATLETGD